MAYSLTWIARLPLQYRRLLRMKPGFHEPQHENSKFILIDCKIPIQFPVMDLRDILIPLFSLRREKVAVDMIV